MGGEEQTVSAFELLMNFAYLLKTKNFFGDTFSPHPPTPCSPQIRIESVWDGKFNRPNLRGEGEPLCNLARTNLTML